MDMDSHSLGLLDQSIQAHVPTVMVPRHSKLEPLGRNGHRFLVARDGLWLEVKTKWCHVVWPYATTEAARTPYGELSKSVRLSFEKLDKKLIEAFVEMARQAYPLETGAVGVLGADGAVSLKATRTLTASECYLMHELPAVGEDEAVVLDLHSHGRLPAFFSDTDLKDMGHATVIAGVVGNLSDEAPTFEFALFAAGLKIPMKAPFQK